MTYDETVTIANRKLLGGDRLWFSFKSKTYCQFFTSNSLPNYIFEISSSNGYLEDGVFSLEILKSNGETAVAVSGLERAFKNPLALTLEEAFLFELEYGVEYPEELINDL